MNDVSDSLHIILANLTVLGQQTRNYHWNVTGFDFGQLHTLFASQYETIDSEIDLVAERIRALNIKTTATLAEYLELTTLSESPALDLQAKEMITNLQTSHTEIISRLKETAVIAEKHGDMETADFIRQITIDHQKMNWMLQAHLS